MGRVPKLSRQETERAIAAAAQAMQPCAALAAILTAEQGKPLAEARGEIAYAPALSNSFPRKQSVSMAIPYQATPESVVGVIGAGTDLND